MVYIHVQWIDPAYIAIYTTPWWSIAKALEVSKAMVTRLAEQPLPNAFTYIFNNAIMADVFIGLLLSLPIVRPTFYTATKQPTINGTYGYISSYSPTQRGGIP